MGAKNDRALYLPPGSRGVEGKGPLPVAEGFLVACSEQHTPYVGDMRMHM